ncbi:hypothetical protein SFRURICE_008266 [Spodoptera frugiperda]|nr:hypothetical protein SFRURICE_008266 [Spodoptera frugiperda]
MDNNTIDSNSTDTDSNSTFVGDGAHIAYTYIDYVVLCFTILVFVIGTVTWCTIKKFRHFKNYVFISAILSGALNDIVAALYIFYRFNYSQYVMLCYIFYVDFVKVFRLDIHRRYLKSSLFAWGLSFLSTIIYFILICLVYVNRLKQFIVTFRIGTIVLLLVPVAISFIIYIAVVYSLFRSNDKGANKPFNKWTRFYISTLTFVLSNIIVLAAVIDFFQLEILIVDVIGELGEYLNKVALNVYIIIVKGNRNLWFEFLNKKTKQNRLEMK